MLSEWKKEDGYYEAVLEIKNSYGDIIANLKLRAVKCGIAHQYIAVVRDAKSGHMLGSSQEKMGKKKAMKKAKEIAKALLNEQILTIREKIERL